MKKVSSKKLSFNSKSFVLISLSVLQIVMAGYLISVSRVGAESGLNRAKHYSSINQLPYRNATK